MEDKILELMRSESQPLSAGQVAEKLGADRKEVDKAMTSLKKKELIESPKKCYWTARA